LGFRSKIAGGDNSVEGAERGLRGEVIKKRGGGEMTMLARDGEN